MLCSSAVGFVGRRRHPHLRFRALWNSRPLPCIVCVDADAYRDPGLLLALAGPLQLLTALLQAFRTDFGLLELPIACQSPLENTTCVCRLPECFRDLLRSERFATNVALLLCLLVLRMLMSLEQPLYTLSRCWGRSAAQQRSQRHPSKWIKAQRVPSRRIFSALRQGMAQVISPRDIA